MFCPKCGTENTEPLRYCRACRHELGAHRLALDRNVDEGRIQL